MIGVRFMVKVCYMIDIYDFFCVEFVVLLILGML